MIVKIVVTLDDQAITTDTLLDGQSIREFTPEFLEGLPKEDFILLCSAAAITLSIKQTIPAALMANSIMKDIFGGDNAL